MNIYKELRRIAASYLRKKLIFYIYDKTNEDEVSLAVKHRVICTLEEYLNYSNVYNYPISPYYAERFKAGAKYFLIHDENEYFTYGWIIDDCSQFNIKYFDSVVMVGKNNYIAFDFFTNEKHRKKGHYVEILAIIQNQLPLNAKVVIYTAPSNYGSRKGILKAGFIEVGTCVKVRIKKIERIMKKNRIDFKAAIFATKNKKRRAVK